MHMGQLSQLPTPSLGVESRMLARVRASARARVKAEMEREKESGMEK